MKLFGGTDIGKIRSSNEDVYCYKVLNDTACFAMVCDGMGGENGGQIASAVASQLISESIIRDYQPDLSVEEYKDIVITAMSEGNIGVFEKAQSNALYHGMGTTGIVVFMVDNTAYIAHVGDSRLYLLREEELYQVTRDHSLVQTLFEKGEITAEEAAHHPQKNMVTRAIGVSRFVDIDYIEIDNIEDSCFLLCTDGLTNSLSDEDIKEVMLTREPEDVCETLIQLANIAGGADNITTVYMTRS